ncbi:MAG TPA: hypothetical protein VFC10_12420 [Terriglobia bacterium]|nr:hypothetical protein [Terriglobia bacterium]
METLTRDELRFLFEMRRRPCLSIFLPTHRAGREIEADRIRLKDLIRDAEAQLAAISIGKRHIRELLAPARSLIERREFWRYQRDGLAVFAAPGYFRYLRVPLPLQNFLFVSDRFDITPLLPLWTLEDGFYLLAISRKCTRLLEGTRFAVHETNNAAIPRSFNDALESMVDVSRREQRTAKAGMPSDLLLYFRAIDRGLRGVLNNHKLPLVLAAVEEEQRFYRDVNTYQKLLPEGVVGNPDHWNAAELHAKAWSIVQEHYNQARREAVRLYEKSAGTPKTSTRLEEIVPAAFHGRVFHLYVAMGATQCGTFDPENNSVSVHDQAHPGDEDLVNLAVIHTILNGGSIFTLPASEMPEGSQIAALFRY